MVTDSLSFYFFLKCLYFAFILERHFSRYRTLACQVLFLSFSSLKILSHCLLTCGVSNVSNHSYLFLCIKYLLSLTGLRLFFFITAFQQFDYEMFWGLLWCVCVCVWMCMCACIFPACGLLRFLA